MDNVASNSPLYHSFSIDLISCGIVHVSKTGSGFTSIRKREGKLGSESENALIFAAARATAAKKQRGQQAPAAAIDAVEASARLSFAEGFALEQELFRDCLASEQSKALDRVAAMELFYLNESFNSQGPRPKSGLFRHFGCQ